MLDVMYVVYVLPIQLLGCHSCDKRLSLSLSLCRSLIIAPKGRLLCQPTFYRLILGRRHTKRLLLCNFSARQSCATKVPCIISLMMFQQKQLSVATISISSVLS